MGAVGAFLAHDRLCFIFPCSYFTGDKSRLGKFPFDGDGVRRCFGKRIGRRKFVSEQDETKVPNTKPSERLPNEVLVEKVRELEAAKREEEAARLKQLEQRRNTARILGEKIHLSPPMSDEEARKQMGKYSRRSFLLGGGAALLGAGSLYWLHQPEQGWIWDRIFKRTFKTNEDLAQLYYSPANLAPEFPKERIGQLRINGGEGMSEGFDPATGRLRFLGVAEEKKYPQYKDDIS